MGDTVSLTILRRPFSKNGTQPEARPEEIKFQLRYKRKGCQKLKSPGKERHSGMDM